MNKPELFGFAGLCIFVALWVILASVPQYPSQPQVYLPSIGLGAFIGAIGFYLIGYAMDEDRTQVSMMD
ncbi:MAG: hypothetical protein RTU63_04935 [Candidatus Thorarchaeota archaeon]